MTVIKSNNSHRAIVAGSIKSRSPRIENIRAPRNRDGVRQKVYIGVIGGDKILDLTVCIVSATGKYIENGMAVQQRKNNCWVYETVHRNQVISGAKITAVGLTARGKIVSLDVVI